MLSPGLRVGWLIAPAELLAKATMCKQFSDAHTSTFAQATAAQYLKAGRMPATLAKVRAVYAERAQAMGDALRKELGDAIAFVQPQGGLFVWARLTGARGQVADGNVLAKKAIEQGVAFVPGTPFFARSPTTPRCACRSPRPMWTRSAKAWPGWARRCAPDRPAADRRGACWRCPDHQGAMAPFFHGRTDQACGDTSPRTAM